MEGLPASVNEFMQKALAKDPDDRFQSGTEFCEAMNEAVGVADVRVVPSELRAGAEVAIQTMMQLRADAPPDDVEAAGGRAAGGRGLLLALGGVHALLAAL